MTVRIYTPTRSMRRLSTPRQPSAPSFTLHARFERSPGVYFLLRPKASDWVGIDGPSHISSPGIWTHSNPQKFFLSVCHWPEPLLRGDPSLETAHIWSAPALSSRLGTCHNEGSQKPGCEALCRPRALPADARSLRIPAQARGSGAGSVYFLDPYFSPDSCLSLAFWF